MKFRRILAMLLTLATMVCFAACSSASDNSNPNGANNGGDDTNLSDTVKMKFFKAGRSTCIVIRTPAGVIMIDTAADDQTDDILTYLAEKEVTTIDYLIITNFSKKHIGGAPLILASSGVTVNNVIVPDYAKYSNTYNLFANALSTKGITPTVAAENQTITLGDVTVDLYVPHKDYSTSADENDEGNSMAVAVNYGDKSMLMTSRVSGERVTELLSDLGGKTFDVITVPNYGIYSSTYDSLFNSVKATHAIAICSNNDTKDQMHDETISALTAAGTLIYATRDGSVEVHITKTDVTVNGTAINKVG